MTAVQTGELPARLWELLLLQAELTQQAVPWLEGEVGYPRTQLRALGETLLALEIQVRDTLDEARLAYRELQRSYEAQDGRHLRAVS